MGVVFDVSRVGVVLHSQDWIAADVLLTVQTLLRHCGDATMFLAAGTPIPAGLAGDPRVRVGGAPAARSHVETDISVHQPLRVTDAFPRTLAMVEHGPADHLSVTLGDAVVMEVLARRAGTRSRQTWRALELPAHRAGVLLVPATRPLEQVFDSEPHRDLLAPARAVGQLVGQDSPPADRPVFVFGSGFRTGSTLLQRLVMSDRRTWLWGEPWDRSSPLIKLLSMWAPVGEDWPTDDHFHVPDRPWAEWVAVTSPPPERLLEVQRSFIRQFLAPPSGPWGNWGLKEVRMAGPEIEWLLTLFPAARVVLGVRDPWDAYASYAARSGWYRRWPHGRIDDEGQFATMWAQLAEDFLALRDRSQCLLVRNEDLREGGAVDALRQHLGTDLDATVIEDKVRGTPKPPRNLDEATIRAIEAVAGDTAHCLGYARPG